MAKHFDVEVLAVKIGRMKDEAQVTFDGMSLGTFLSHKQLFNSRHNAYATVANDLEDDEDQDADTSALHTPSAVSHRSEEQQQPDDNMFVIEDSELQYIEDIGQGAEGRIRKASWRGSNVAVKDCVHTRPEDVDSNSLKEEAKVLANLKHPNVLQFFGVTFRNNVLAIVVELMECSLFERIFAEEGNYAKLNDKQKKEIALGIIRGVTYLHSRNIVHTDIKLENILLSVDASQVKICDFGLARTKMTATATVVQGTTAGTTMYKSPEMVLVPTSGNFQSDVWAMGGVIAEMYSEKVLWTVTGRNVEKFMKSAFKKRQEPTVCKDLKVWQPAVYGVLRACFHYDPALRPTPFDLLEAFQGLKM